jgi:hypothetical protein
VKKYSILILPFLLASCGIAMFANYGEWVDSNTVGVDPRVTATLDWSTLPGVITAIDGREFGRGYKTARLAAGVHDIEYSYYTGAFGTNLIGSLQFDFVEGHEYEFRMKLCFWCVPRRYAIWVDDKATGQLVWGRRPDWPSWYL